MKWFKHDSDAHRDPKLKKLILKYGLEGYGLYFYCLELIAHEVVTNKLTFELEHDSEIIAHDLRMSRELVEDMMKYMVQLGLFENVDGKIVCLKMMHRIDTSQSGNPEFRRQIAEAKKSGNVPIVMTQSGHSHDSVKTKSCLDIDLELEVNKPISTRTKRKRFVPPTVEQVSDFAKEIGKHIDPNDFVNYYASKGWMVGRTKMSDWKAAVRRWKGDGPKQQHWSEQGVVL